MFIHSIQICVHSRSIQTWQLSGRLCAAQLFTVQRDVQWCLTRAGLSLPASMIVNRKHLITIGHCCQCSLPFRITSVLSLGQSSLHIVLVRTFQPLLPEQDTRRSLSLVPWEIMICQCQAWSKPCSAVMCCLSFNFSLVAVKWEFSWKMKATALETTGDISDN